MTRGHQTPQKLIKYQLHINEEMICQIHGGSGKFNICKASVPLSHARTDFDSTMPVQSYLANHSRMVWTRHPHHSHDLTKVNILLFRTEKTALRKHTMISRVSRRRQHNY